MKSRDVGDFVFQFPVPSQFPRVKVGRNDSCPCGSGKKFKKCCLNEAPRPITVVPQDLVEETQRHLRMHQTRLRNHADRHGHVREAIHTTFQGRKFVAVGSTLHYSRPERPWRTFHDFLMEYVARSLGREWATAQQARNQGERHPVFEMFEGWWAFQRQHENDPDVDGVVHAPWTGSVASLATLAYDLFTVGDNAQLQERLLVRLRHPDQYQGARYELFVIAACVRAGFSVEYEDENDRSRKHPELVATHKATGLQVAIEAKSRHRPGVLGFKAPAAAPKDGHRARIRSLLFDALKKKPGRPYVIFVDVNLPGPAGNEDCRRWVREVGQETLPSIPLELLRTANVVLCTNVTFHRTPATIPESQTIFTSHVCLNPMFFVDRAILDALAEAVRLFGNVPQVFPASSH